MVKIDLITGFLGSGKTTFIRKYAIDLINRGERICIIENDYGAVNIDMVMLQDLFGDNCNLEMIVGGDGKEAHMRRFRTKLISMGMSGYDRVIIEPSGIYDVDEFFDVLYESPLDRWYEIGSVIAIVDAQAVFGIGGLERYVFMTEIACAGKLVYTKLTAEQDAGDITSEVNNILTEYGVNTFDGKDIIAKPFEAFTDKDFEDIQNSGYRHASYVKVPIEDKQFTPLFYFEVVMPENKLKEIAKSLFVSEEAGHVIRIKGFVQTEDGGQLEINATEKKIELLKSNSSRTVLIIIGERLDKDYINSVLKDYCGVVSL